MSKESCGLSIEALETKIALTNDPLFGSQWGLSFIHASEAWNNVSITNKPIVAIVDSGIDLNNSDLKDNLWTNPKEIPNDGIDNDSNGYVDDINGWNFVNLNNKPQDDYYHGTHVAGIVGAVSNNNIGVAGVAPNVSIMPLKFQGSNGMGYAGAAIYAINYAVSMKNRGENIVAINISWTTGLSDNTGIKNALQKASDADIVVVVAGGNDGQNLDVSSARYPVAYNLKNEITVASINPDASISGFSNYGKNYISIGAPGSNILSTLPGNAYGNISGTSMAAPFVSGAVAFLKSINIYYSASQIKSAILNGASYVSNLADKVGVGVLNLKGAVEKLLTMKPALSPLAPAAPVVPPAPSFGVMNYHLDTVSKSLIKGWANDSVNSNVKLVVEIRINNVLRYSVPANLYRSDTRASNGFSISINKGYLKRGLNSFTITLKNPVTNGTNLIYSGKIRK